MKLIIDTSGFSYLGVEFTENCGPLLAALQTAQPYQKDWNSNKFKPLGTKEEPKGLSFEIVREEYFGEAQPLVDKLQEDIKCSDRRWLDYYNKYAEAQKEIKELEEKLKEVEKILEPTKEVQA